MSQINLLIETMKDTEFNISVIDRYSQGYQTEVIYDKDEFEWIEDISLKNESVPEVLIGSNTERLIKFKALKAGDYTISVSLSKAFDPDAEVITNDFLVTVKEGV